MQVSAETKGLAMAPIQEATTEVQLSDVRNLMRAFVAWHRARHVEDLALIERYFDQAAFDAELAALPGAYAPPAGRLLIAYKDGQPAGCVALHDLGQGICEMKRMFVPVRFRGLGIGRALAETLLDQARSIGYRRMRLDTSKRQAEAIRLYESLGFGRIDSYHPLPAEFRGWLLFFEAAL